MDKVYKLIGLAKRAGKVKSGEANVKQSIQEGSAYVVFIASDISENTKKSITNSCNYYDISCYTLGDMITLGHSIGNEFNAAVAVTDEGLANLITERLKNINGGVL
ncbi:MAG: 50S ribosomal protein L7ae [Ruminococcaceae bacterium]|nr:50S ribosomal protein L7ae [Oscillospiraceae bacterium]